MQVWTTRYYLVELVNTMQCVKLLQSEASSRDRKSEDMQVLQYIRHAQKWRIPRTILVSSYRKTTEGVTLTPSVRCIRGHGEPAMPPTRANIVAVTTHDLGQLYSFIYHKH